MTLRRLKYSIIFFYLGLFLFLALYDERLDPELARELAKPRPKVIEPGNAWIAMLGMDAPAGVAPRIAGEKQLRDLDAALQAGKTPVEILSGSLADKNRLSFKGKMPPFYGKDNSGILAYAATHPDEAAGLARDNVELLDRYEQLCSLPRYVEPLTYGFSGPFPRFSSARNGQRLKLLLLARQASRGDLTGALANLRDDMAFWRLAARNSETLISKIISLSALQIDIQLAAELGASRHLTPPEVALVQELLHPFDKGETSFVKVFHGEALFSYYGMEQNAWNLLQHWGPDRLIFKHNATSNRVHAYYFEFARQADLMPNLYAEAKKQPDKRKADPFKIGIPFLYNPSGELLVQIAKPVLSGYIERGHNVEGLRRLALLKIQAHAENILPEQMQAYLGSHAAVLSDPYTGKPMTWDAKNRRVFFPKLSEAGTVEIKL